MNKRKLLPLITSLALVGCAHNIDTKRGSRLGHFVERNHCEEIEKSRAYTKSNVDSIFRQIDCDFSNLTDKQKVKLIDKLDIHKDIALIYEIDLSSKENLLNSSYLDGVDLEKVASVRLNYWFKYLKAGKRFDFELLEVLGEVIRHQNYIDNDQKTVTDYRYEEVVNPTFGSTEIVNTRFRFYDDIADGLIDELSPDSIMKIIPQLKSISLRSVGLNVNELFYVWDKWSENDPNFVNGNDYIEIYEKYLSLYSDDYYKSISNLRDLDLYWAMNPIIPDRFSDNIQVVKKVQSITDRGREILGLPILVKDENGLNIEGMFGESRPTKFYDKDDYSSLYEND